MANVNSNYILIYNWLKNTGAKIAKNEIACKEPFRLIENIPEPKVATDAEIYAIAVEIRSGCLEYFYCEKENELGQSLAQLAKEICLSCDINDICAELDKQQSKICQYISKYKNADIQEYDYAQRSFAYVKLYKSIGIILDGDNKGCGISINDENQYFYNSDGDFDDKSDVKMTVVGFKNVRDWGGEHLFGCFSSKDFKPIEGKNFSCYAYFSVLLNGKETTILIEKSKAMEKRQQY